MKKITISDIARLAGCSKATVSLVLNNDKRVSENTRCKVLEIIKKYKFRPNYFARKLSLKDDRPSISEVSIVVPRARSVFVGAMLSEIEELFYKDGLYDVKFSFYTTVGQLKLKHEILRKLLYEKMTDLIVAITLKPEEDFIKDGKEIGIPFILIENESPNAYSILIDNERGVNLALNYLKRSGRKHIVIVCGTPKVAEGAEPNFSAIARFEAAMKWLKKNKVLYVKDRFYYVNSYIYEEGYQVVDKILQDHSKVDAIVSLAGDVVASGILERLKEKNIQIPNQVALVGFDNYKLICENTSPKLTTIDQKLNTVAKYVHHIIKSLKDGKPLEKKVFKIFPELVVRESA